MLDGATLVSGWSWIPAAGLNATFRLDGFGLLFALLILGIGLLVILYARYYLSPEDSRSASTGCCCSSWARCSAWCSPRTCCCWSSFWELTSLSSFLLIGFWRHERGRARAAPGWR